MRDEHLDEVQWNPETILQLYNERMTAKDFQAKYAGKRDTCNDLPLNEMFAQQLMAAGVPFEREVQFARPRKWRADFMVQNVLIELQGGVWSRATKGHNSGAGIARDCEKHNAAIIAGYKVLLFETKAVQSGEALQTTLLALGIGLNKGPKPGHAR